MKMKEDILKTVKGKKIRVLELSLYHAQCQIDLTLKLDCNNTIFVFCFYNVSRISIQELSLPMEIYGFEIINNKEKGWEQDSNYEIRDYEDSRIRFFCDSFEIT